MPLSPGRQAAVSYTTQPCRLTTSMDLCHSITYCCRQGITHNVHGPLPQHYLLLQTGHYSQRPWTFATALLIAADRASLTCTSRWCTLPCCGLPQPKDWNPPSPPPPHCVFTSWSLPNTIGSCWWVAGERHYSISNNRMRLELTANTQIVQTQK